MVRELGRLSMMILLLRTVVHPILCQGTLSAAITRLMIMEYLLRPLPE